MSIKSTELRKEAVAIHQQAVELMKTENRTKEQDAKIDTVLGDVDAKLAEAERLERAEKQEAELRSSNKPPLANPGTSQEERTVDPKVREAEERSAFFSYITGGEAGLSQEQRQLLRRAPVEKRDGQVSTLTQTSTGGSAGGFLVPQGYQRELEVAMKAYGNLLGDARILDTASGNLMYWPTVNDTSQEATVVGEAGQVTEQDLVFSHVQFGAYKFTSGLVKVSLELEQDAFNSIDDTIKNAFAIRFGRGLNRKFTTGSGSGEPTGILTAIDNSGATPVIAVGDVANTGNTNNNGTNSIGYFDLVNLMHSVDPAYRDLPGAKFMFHDQVLQQLRKLLDKYGRPIWQAGVTAGAPATILDKPYSINQQMPLSGDSSPANGLAVTDDNPVIVFGDLTKFVIRRVREMSVIRLVERYAEFGQVALLGFARYDSNLVDAGTHPVNYLKMDT
jgi:HK97 family phage major capsid protein